MNIKVSVKRKLVVNGKEYASPEEMPDDLRRAYERAVGGELGAAGHTPVRSKIVFQGKEYESPADMPEELRKLYELALAAANLTGSQASGVSTAADAEPRTVVERNGVFVSAARDEAKVRSAAPPHDFSVRLKIGRNGLLLVFAALLILFWLVLSGPGAHIP